MGLGKSLQVVTLIHTLQTHPRLIRNNRPIIDRILLIVPVNTLENWKAEFKKWLTNIPKIVLYDFTSTAQNSRKRLSERWEKSGGIMLVTQDTLSRAIKSKKNEDTAACYKRVFITPGPDALFIDEGHLMLKNRNTGISKVLFSMATPRRIVLTGTPLQNNLLEFYQMANWVDKGCLGTEAEFEKKFASKIMTSLTVSCWTSH